MIGLAGLAGNDTLTGGVGDDWLFGDFFSVGMWDDNDPYDTSVIGNDVIFGGAGNDALIGGPVVTVCMAAMATTTTSSTFPDRGTDFTNWPVKGATRS